MRKVLDPHGADCLVGTQRTDQIIATGYMASETGGHRGDLEEQVAGDKAALETPN